MRALIPINDAERNVLRYKAMEEPIAKTFRRYTDRTAKGLFKAISAILDAGGYDGTNAATVMVRPADHRTIRELEALAESLPDRQRKAMLSKIWGQVGGGSLTIRRAMRDVMQFGVHQASIRPPSASSGP